MTFSDARTMPQNHASGSFLGEHGSWNRGPRGGCKVVHTPFAKVGFAMEGNDGLLATDDVGNVVWRVAPPPR